MYFTFGDTQPCILNDKIIIAKVAVEWNRKMNKISTKIQKKGAGGTSCGQGVDNSAEFYRHCVLSTEEQNQNGVWLIFVFYSLTLIVSK